MGVGSRWSVERAHLSPAAVPGLSQLHGLKDCPKVAAVCYRFRGREIEFLLVQTRNRRWTFPKGSAERGLTHAQAAALEAYEEAGVHGRIAETPFTSYVHSQANSRRAGAKSARQRLAVNAHLCEVVRLDPPPEKDRNPAWFTPPQAKRRLRERRKSQHAAELVRVVDEAMVCILRSQAQQDFGLEEWQRDPLRTAPFEAHEIAGAYGGWRQAAWSLHRKQGDGDPAVEVAVNAYLYEVLRSGPLPTSQQNPALPVARTKRMLTNGLANSAVVEMPQRHTLRITEVPEDLPAVTPGRVGNRK